MIMRSPSRPLRWHTTGAGSAAPPPHLPLHDKFHSLHMPDLLEPLPHASWSAVGGRWLRAP